MTNSTRRGERSVSRPGRSLPPGKTRYSLYRRLVGSQGRSGQVRKISPPTGIRSPDRPARSQSLYRLSYPAHTHYIMVYDMIYLLTATGLSPGGSTHLHTNSNRTTQITTNVEECGPCPVFASFTLAFALQLRKKHGKTSVRVRSTSVRLRKTSVRLRKPQSE